MADMVLVKDGAEILDSEDIVCAGCEIIEICPHADPALTLCPIGWNDEEGEE